LAGSDFAHRFKVIDDQKHGLLVDRQVLHFDGHILQACIGASSADNSLDPSFPRRRESSKKNSPRSGQSLDIDPLCGD
jgi:hypothetical protein